MPEDVHLVVLDEGMYVGNGVVNRWLTRLGNRLYQNTVIAAPERTGDLKSMIDLDFEQGPSLRVLSAVVSSNAPYTKYVIEGTAQQGVGYIYSTQGFANRGLVERMLAGARVEGSETEGMWLVIEDGGPKFHLRVHGQRANNFLAEGYNKTARTHRSLNPIFPGITT
jgi:hypothetical protein